MEEGKPTRKVTKNKIITKHKTNDKKCTRIDLVDPPRARSEIQNKSMLMVQSRFQSAIDDSRRRGASCKNCTRFVNFFFCFCLCISFCNSLLLLPNVAVFFFLCVFFSSSLHVIHSVFLHSFLSFFLSLPLRSSSCCYFSFFLFNLVAIVGSLYLIFVAFPFLWNWRYK
jgi:Flp pilus assembly protein TadB